VTVHVLLLSSPALAAWLIFALLAGVRASLVRIRGLTGPWVMGDVMDNNISTVAI